MSHAPLIASLISDAARRAGHPVELEQDALIFPGLEIFVLVSEGDETSTPSGTSISNSIVAHHQYFPNGAIIELCVGLGDSTGEAAKHIAKSWLDLVFPVLECLINSNACHPMVEVRQLPEGYRLIQGPVHSIHLIGSSFEERLHEPHFWRAIQDIVPSIIGRGIRHLRFYVAISPDGPFGDVFLDGKAWPEATERILGIAAEFPNINKEVILRSLKQHIILSAGDLAVGHHHEALERAAEWQLAIQDRINSCYASFMRPILLGIFFCSRFGSDDLHKGLLIVNGVDEALAEDVQLFLPNVTARVAFGDQVRFGDTYFLQNKTSELAMRHRYSESVVFRAAMEILTALHATRLAGDALLAILSKSADMNAINQALNKGAKLKEISMAFGICTTDREIVGRPLEALISEHEIARRKPSQGKPWWKFW